MRWRRLAYSSGGASDVATATCAACRRSSVWWDQEDPAIMVWPLEGGGVPPAEDMPEAVALIYNEARSVVKQSPRSASALLRLALEGLLNDLYPDATNLNDAIGKAAADGLPRRVIDSMDVLRFNGNAAIHEVSREDTPQTAAALFKVLNIVVRHLITEPREIASLHSELPEGVRAQIEKRDATS